MSTSVTPATPPLSPDLDAGASPRALKSISSRPASILLTPPYTPNSSSSPKIYNHSPQLGYGSSSREVSPERSLLAKSFSDLQIEAARGVDDGQAGESVRLLSDNELSYFLPSRADGVNDMYLHHRLTAPAHQLETDRVFYLWAYQLLRHPLLASYLRVKSYEDVSFVFPHSHDVVSALSNAEDRFIYIDDDDEHKGVDIIDSYLNGPRTLSSDRLATLVVADKGPVEGSDVNGDDDKRTFEVMLLSTHFLGDGMALHTFMNEFYTLLGSEKTAHDILDMIADQVGDVSPVPKSLEERMPKVGNGSRMARSIGQVDNKRNDSRLIGGQSFPSNKVKSQRRTVVPTFPYTPEETKKILGRCKENGVTIAHAVFALCNLAWARRLPAEQRADPTLIYSALNLRPNMLKEPSELSSSYFHLAVGYFNIVLPTLMPSDLSTSEIFWHRARSTKAQTVKAVKSSFVVSRSRETNKIRRDRAIKWAKIDDEDERRKLEASAAAAESDAVSRVKSTGAKLQVGLGLGVLEPERNAPEKSSEMPGPKFAPVRADKATPATTPSPKPSPQLSAPAVPVPAPAAAAKDILPPASQKALMGLSMLGNLDGMYKHASYPSIQLEALTTGSRQRAGGLLLFAYTFCGKLWMSLGYDVNGFQEGVIEGFWEEVQALVREVLL